jgi:two-component system, OmpR family, sensor histidine kinase VicK
LLDALPEMIRLRVPRVAVETCGSALAALERIGECDYDAIITDIKMPVMDGLSLLTETAKVQPETPVLLITGHGEHDLSVQALRRGAFDFISKPIDREYFPAALERALGVKDLRRQIAAQNLRVQRHMEHLESEVAKRTEELVRSHAAKDALAAIVESSDDAIISKDLDGIVRSWNPAAVRMYGYTAEEMVGSSITSIIPEDRLSEETEVLDRVRAGFGIEHFETVRVRKDGSFIDVSVTVSPVRDANGEIVGASKIARDISKRLEAEAAIRESEELKDQFLSLVSHELRTPIAVIAGNSLVLLKRIDQLHSADRNQALADIAFEADRLQRIIENLLLLTKVGGREPLPIEHVRLDRLVDAAVGTIRRRSPERVITFECQHKAIVLGDPTLTSLVVENLVGNADKYSPSGQCIEVSLDFVEGPSAMVCVADRGPGLTDEEVDQVFAPFYRTVAAKNTASGMGLGLAVCKKAIEEQGGQIGARARPGGGTEFWFTLPLAPEPEFA